MQPLSIVESEGFKEFVATLDPSFTMPNRKTIKNTGIPAIKDQVYNKLKKTIKSIQYPNISVDGWSDATSRPFNGYICQGIDEDWNLKTLNIDFRPLAGELIKKFYIKSLFLINFNY